MSLSIAFAPHRSVGFHARLVAALIHLALSGAVVGGLILLAYLCWYPFPLDRISGVGHILLLLLMVDLTLGPVMTFVVFDRRKKSLKLDLAMIAMVQILGLIYGIHAVEAGRPHFLVFVKDRFEVVSKADIDAKDWEASVSNPSARPSFLGPRVVAAEFPESLQRRQEILLEAVMGGRDIQNLPTLFRPYDSQAKTALSRSRPLEDLRELNPSREADIERASNSTGRPMNQIRFLPLKGPQGDATVLIDGQTGEVLKIVPFRPWTD